MSAAVNGLLLGGAIVRVVAGQAPHVARYFARLRAQLDTLPPNAHALFLRGEIAKWQERYASFVRKVDAGIDTGSEVSAWDFMETLGDLDRLLAGVEGRAP